MEEKTEIIPGDERRKNDAESDNDSTNEMRQMEKLIDPGNEHRHDDVNKFSAGPVDNPKQDAGTGDDK